MAAESHMENIRKLSDEFLKNTDEEDYSSIVQIHEVIKNSSSLSILSLVEVLANVLTNENVEKRQKGTKLLANYIHLCGPEEFSSKEIEPLVLFFCDRLQDHHSIQPLVIYAFLGIVSHQQVSDELVIKMLQSLFSEVHVQSLVQADRHNVFNLFGNLLKTKLNVLRQICNDFVLGFIQAMDSERDPRNLLICFQNSYMVLKELDISLFAEDFFEVLSCYFPIDFKPPKDNPFGITREDLVLGLRSCLTSSTLFAPYAIPLYIDKLASDIVDAKKDALLTFTESLPYYKGQDLELFINDIWMSIRKDFLLGENEELHLLYSDFIKAMSQCLIKSNCTESLSSMVAYLLKDSLQTLKDPEMTIAIQCGKLINIFSALSGEVFEKILETLLPPIEISIAKYSSSAQRQNLLDFIVNLTSVDPEIITNPTCKNQLKDFIEKHLSVFYTYLHNCENAQLTVLSLACLKQIIRFNATYAVNTELIAEHVFKLVFTQDIPQSVLEELKMVIYELATNYPNLVDKSFVGVLESSQSTSTSLNNSIMLLYQCRSNFQDRIIQFLIKMLENCDTFDTAVKCLCNVLNDSPSKSDNDFLLKQIYALILSNQEATDSTLEGYIKVITSAFRNLNENKKSEELSHVFNMMLERDPAVDNSTGIYNTISVVCVGIIPQSSLNLLKSVDVNKLVDNLWHMQCSKEDAAFRKYSGLCIGSLVNKLADSKLVQYLLKLVKDNVENLPRISLQLLSWVAKGCILNWQSSTQGCLKLLIVYLKQPKLGEYAADGFKILVQTEILALNKESGGIVKFTYKQRFSQLVLPSLMDSYREAESDVKAYLITAISCMLQITPKQMLQTHLKKLLPLLLHSLATSTNDEILLSTVNTILSVCDQNKELIQEHAGDLIQHLLTLVTHTKMAIRIASLKCLTTFSGYPTHDILLMKNDVIRRMRCVVDDKKRLVRKEAVTCSNAWHLIG